MGGAVYSRPVAREVAAIDAGDAVLAIRIDRDSSDGEAIRRPERAWAPEALAPAPPAAALDVVEELFDRFAGGPLADPAAALGILCRHSAAAAGALLEQVGDGEPRIVAAWGDIRAIGRRIDLDELVRRPDEGPDAAAGDRRPRRCAGTPPGTTAAFVRRGSRLLVGVLAGFAAGGAGQPPADCGPLLAILLRLVDGGAGMDGPAARPSRSAGGMAIELPLTPAPGLVACVSPAMRAAYAEVERIRDGEFPVLVVGETGVGKEHVVRLLHQRSARGRAPLVAVNCAAIPADLLEAELFGVGRGAATGVQERKGKFQLAHGGTLFLDEIGEMPLALQAKLLRVVEERAVQPLGGAAVAIDVRIVAATNAGLLERAAAGRFRADLYYRLAGYVLEVPPLRRRREDITVLVQAFLGRLAREAGTWIPGVTLRALERLTGYAWPGNVRQLESTLRRLVYQCPDGQPIDSSMLVEPIAGAADAAAPADGDGTLHLAVHTDALERRLLHRALERSKGNQRAAAALLGISRNGLRNRMQRLGVARFDGSPSPLDRPRGPGLRTL